MCWDDISVIIPVWVISHYCSKCWNFLRRFILKVLVFGLSHFVFYSETKKCRQICCFFPPGDFGHFSTTFRDIVFYTIQFLVLKSSFLTCICILFNKEKFFQIHLFIEAPLCGRTSVKWGKQTGEAEGMKAIIGLWRSKAINCGEIRRLEWFAGKPSEGIGYGNAGRKKVPAGCLEEILSVICTTTHGCLLILALLCHQKQVICCKKRCISTSMKPHWD